MQELMEMGEYEEENHRSYDREDEAKEHAKEFLDKAAEVLSHNKKEGSEDEVTKLAMQMAKDYHEAIVDAIQAERYGNGEGEMGDEEMGDDEFERRYDVERREEDF